jgi:ATPase subunit of ABC transporter with duplicated ATPase domains
LLRVIARAQCVCSAQVNQLESEQAAAPVATASAPLSAIVAEEVAGRTRRIAAIYSRLDAIDAHTAEARARAILFGLGFDEAMQAQPTEAFSGGWRMRIALARALFARPGECECAWCVLMRTLCCRSTVTG